jgi:hypothetical protein
LAAIVSLKASAASHFRVPVVPDLTDSLRNFKNDQTMDFLSVLAWRIGENHSKSYIGVAISEGW